MSNRNYRAADVRCGIMYTSYRNDAGVDAVENLGSLIASGDMAELEVIEIPDGIECYIEDYDGMETIHEVHRSW